MKLWWWAALGAALGAFVFGVARLPMANEEIGQAAMFEPPVRPAPRLEYRPVPPPLPPPPAEPSKDVPTLVRASEQQTEIRIKALAQEMARMWTRNPEELVVAIDDAVRSMPHAPAVTLLLAIAHAETNGRILIVSEAGAVGLAQATPVAYRQEGLTGKLFVTDDYLIGSRAYILKKPLGDADMIATLITESDTPATRKKARALLASAQALRREGIDELELLEPFAPKGYFERIEKMDQHNEAVLAKLGRLIEMGTRDQLREFRNDARTEYRALKQLQHTSWIKYQKELMAKRDQMLAAHFKMNPEVVKKTMAYEASEYLGEHLDDRFSARSMARFLVRHLDRKAVEAKTFATSEAEIEQWTAALYNGGSHNVKRMLAGLIRSLPETDKYMQKVPATKRRLDGVIAGVPLDESAVRTLR